MNFSNDTTNNVIAAKTYFGKAVFCIDNVATSVFEDDMKSFVEAMNVRVLSCFLVQPRRPQWQRRRGIIPSDRHTFRLCIPRDDCEKLLNAEFWPEHISVSHWVFKKKQQPSHLSEQDIEGGTEDEREDTAPGRSTNKQRGQLTSDVASSNVIAAAAAAGASSVDSLSQLTVPTSTGAHRTLADVATANISQTDDANYADATGNDMDQTIDWSYGGDESK